MFGIYSHKKTHLVETGEKSKTIKKNTFEWTEEQEWLTLKGVKIIVPSGLSQE